MATYRVLITETVGKELHIEADDKLDAMFKANSGDWDDDNIVRTEITSRSAGDAEAVEDQTANYKDCTVHVYSVTYYLKDEYGDEVLNEDGSTKIFKDYEGQADTTTWAEHVEPELLEEYEEDSDE